MITAIKYTMPWLAVQEPVETTVERNIAKFMTKKANYELQFLLDPSQIARDELVTRSQQILQRYLRWIQVRVWHVSSVSGLFLSIKGSVKTVNTCDKKLVQDLFVQGNLRVVRWEDEPGEVIRRRMYPIVADIEQNLRLFINRALLEILGFDWWDNWLPTNIRDDVEVIRKRNESYFGTLHPLEMAQFRDLVELITAVVAKWRVNSALSVEDVRSLLEGANSVEDVRHRFEQNTKQLSMWDDVFSLYFDDKHQWHSLAGNLQYVIHERNKVMHHQPVEYSAIRVLKQKQMQLGTILRKAKRRLSATERAQAEQRLKEIATSFSELYKTSTLAIADARQMADEQIKRLAQLSADNMLQVDEQMKRIAQSSADSIKQFDEQMKRMVQLSADSIRQFDEQVKRIAQSPLADAFRHISEQIRQLEESSIDNASQHMLLQPPVSPDNVEQASSVDTEVSRRDSRSEAESSQETSPDADLSSDDQDESNT